LSEVAQAGSGEAGSGRLAGRIALITGASRGIGAAVARRFAAEGAQLILAARTVGGLEELDDRIREDGRERATLVPLDLREFDAIDLLGASLYERFGRLDVLVGNAGVLGTLSPVGHIEPPDWAEVLDINLTANWRLIRSLDPLLRRSEAGRAIFVTSGAAAGPNAYWGAYAVSKAALEMLVRTYAAELAKTKVRANLIDPGAIRTAMRAKAFPGEDPGTLRTPDAIAETFVELAEAACTRNGEVVRAC
jgi:NAD(P)-dependent dehydrogenase (short-subunit alcohol dehydrogenase family)